MPYKSYQDLIVWQKAMDLVDQVYLLVKQLPKEEQFALSEQLRRSAVSVPSNIAEGHGRQGKKEFKHFLAVAKGSVFEVETQILIGLRQHYFSEEKAEATLGLCKEIGKILTRLILTTDSDD